MSEGKRKVMWVSDSPQWRYVGQSRVTREVCRRLNSKYDMCVAGFFDKKEVGKEAIFKDGYPVYNITRDATGLIIDAIHHYNPDVVIMSHDCWEFPNIELFRRKFPKIKFIGWFTIDGDPIDTKWKNLLEACNLIISPTEYGKKVIKDQYMHLDVDVVSYGIDHSNFFKIDQLQKEMHRKSIRMNNGASLEGKFCAIFTGQNHTRKNLGAAFDGWNRFSKGKDDVAYTIITHTRKIKHGEWANMPVDYDLGNWYNADSMLVVDGVVDDPTLSRFYQVSDVMLLPTLGESPSLPLLESMACGVVPIVTNYSGPTDFCRHNENAFLMEGVDFWPQMWHVRRKIVSPETVQESLEIMYNKWKNEKANFHKLAQNAVAASREYDWDKSAAGIMNSIESLFKENRVERTNKVTRV